MSITGTVGNDVLSLTDSAGSAELQGLDGNDTLIGVLGAATMAGGKGDDLYVVTGTTVDDVSQMIVEAAGEGKDTVVLAAPILLQEYRLQANVENIVLASTAAYVVYGNDSNNLITGNAQASYIDGGAGADTMIGGKGNDVFVVDQAGDRVIERTGEGYDTIVTSLGSYNLTGLPAIEELQLSGDGDKIAIGNALDNAISVLSPVSNDWIDGGIGADHLNGGEGSDTYVVDNAGDVVDETGASDGATDLVRSAVSFTLGINVENLTLTGASSVSGIGNGLNNVIIGNAGANLIDGMGGGADTLAGGKGNDTYILRSDSDVVTELAGEGIDTVRVTKDYFDYAGANSYTLADNVENAENLTTLGWSMTGNALANKMTGGALFDWLDGGAGADTLIGGTGDDFYVVDNVGDRVIELAGQGGDMVATSLSAYSLATLVNVEQLSGMFVESGGFTGIGNALDNAIYGSGPGADYLDGGIGADTMYGLGGDDTYVVDNVGDQIDWEFGGTDTVRSSISYTLGADLEHLVLAGTAANGAGNAGDNAITGNALSNLIDGAAGADTMAGGKGNDTYVVESMEDVVVEAASGGVDTISTSLGQYSLDALGTVESLTFTGDGYFFGEGNALANRLTGGTSSDLYGYAGNDTLTGGSSYDYLDGGEGADQMIGGGSDDYYFVDNAGDRTIELAGQGYDWVESSVSYTLQANVEALSLTGNAALAGTGNASDNYLIGNRGNNTLSGGAGDDFMSTGGGGVDKLFGGSGNDFIQYDRVVFTPSGPIMAVMTNVSLGQVDGSTGQDTLYLEGWSAVDFSTIDNAKTTGIETIEMAGFGTTAMTIGVDDIRAMSNEAHAGLVAAFAAAGQTLARPTDALVVEGEAGDSLHLLGGTGLLAGGTWAQVGDYDFGDFYHHPGAHHVWQYTKGGVVQATIAVDTEVTVI